MVSSRLNKKLSYFKWTQSKEGHNLVSGESGNQDKCNMDSSQAKEIEALKIEFCVEKKIQLEK